MTILDPDHEPDYEVEARKRAEALKEDDHDAWFVIYEEGMDEIAKTLRKERKQHWWVLGVLFVMLLGTGGIAVHNKNQAHDHYERAQKFKTRHAEAERQLLNVSEGCRFRLTDHPCNELWHEIHNHRMSIQAMLMMAGAYDADKVRRLVDEDGRYVGPACFEREWAGPLPGFTCCIKDE